jgi:preprotein translocase subunit SecD
VLKTAVPILFLVVGCAGSGVRPLEIHLGDYNATPGLKAFEPQPGEALLYMEQNSVLDDRDFLSVRMATDRFGAPALELCLTPEGKEKSQRVATENVGRHLIFLVEGKLAMAPTIDAGAPLECVTVEGHVTSTDADTLSKAIGRR